MNCPQCGLINPESAQRCDCGYDFQSQTVKTPYYQREGPRPNRWGSCLWWIPASLLFKVLSSAGEEAGTWIIVTLVCIGLGYVLYRQAQSTNSSSRRIMGEFVTEEVDSIAEPVKKVDKSEDFFNYYMDPNPERAPDALRESIEKGVFNDPQNVVWYLYVRVARDNPWLTRSYEHLFTECFAGRVVVLKILQQVGDRQTRNFLENCLEDLQFQHLRTELQTALENWPAVTIDPLARPVSSRADLDLLWCEFRATGNTQAVLRIIDVFERPDRIRTKLAEWLHATPRSGFSILAAILKKNTVLRLWKQASILCDVDSREILSPQDLDCHCIMQGTTLNHERASKVARLLPFSVYGEDSHLLFKAAARWSLASHGREHPIVLELCKSEAARRIGRSRILLLEIVAYVSLERQDLESAFRALGESLTVDPTAEHHREEKAAAAWNRLLRLPPEALPDLTQPSPERAVAVRCVVATQSADCYRTKRIIRRAHQTEDDLDDVVWECEFAQPANFHVSQIMRWDSGPVYDEWVTLGGKHFRGPMYVQAPDSDRKTNSSLLASEYFPVLRRWTPARSGVLSCDGTSYLFFEYPDAPAPMRSGWDKLTELVGVPSRRCHMLVWADCETGRLAKVVQTFRPSLKSEERMQIVHLFSCYNEAVSIVPPAFSIFQPTKSTVGGRLKGLLPSWR